MSISGIMPAVTQVALTVTDDSVCETWYRKVLGTWPVLDGDNGHFRYLVCWLDNTLVQLHGFSELDSKEPFNELTRGLDHLAFGCANRAELVGWASCPDDLGMAHREIGDAHYGSGLAFRDPDNITLELFAPAA